MVSQSNNFIGVVIVEDEAHNSRMLQGLIEKLRPDWEVQAILESVEESILWFKKNEAPELILMDIQLSDGICFSIFDQVKIPPSCKIIFTTAYDEYALRAFKVNSIDYLLKPIEENDIEIALKNFEELIGFENPETESSLNYQDLIQSIIDGKKAYRTRFLISGLNGYHKLEINEVAYFYSENKLTFAVDTKNNEHVVDYNLEQLELELDPALFYRANRKIILHINSVSKINTELGSKLRIILNPRPEFDVIVSRLKASDFKKWMGK